MHYKTRSSDLLFSPVNYLPEKLRKTRLRSEVMADIKKDAAYYGKFLTLTKDAQEALIEFCMGNRGLKIIYDPFFHKILQADMHPERLSSLISAILKQKVKIKRVLPREGIQLAEGGSLMIVDILVELEDGSLVNVEIQRYGYYFPIQRSFCYGSDIMVRQYAQLRDVHGTDFSYKMMQPIYIIVLMENSPKVFKQFPNTYIHRSKFTFDSGIELGNLINFIYIPLDIFVNIPHNNIGELEAWLYFLGSDKPSDVQRIIDKYPFFEALYKEIIDFQFEPKELISMYSEALAIMDRNTVNLMIDDMKKEAEELKGRLEDLNNEIAKQKEAVVNQQSLLASQETLLADREIMLASQESKIASQENTIANQENTIASQENMIASQKSAIAEKDAEIERLRKLLEGK